MANVASQVPKFAIACMSNPERERPKLTKAGPAGRNQIRYGGITEKGVWQTPVKPQPIPKITAPTTSFMSMSLLDGTDHSPPRSGTGSGLLSCFGVLRGVFSLRLILLDVLHLMVDLYKT